jgi:pyruvate formate lyase activating enzyme
VGVVECTLCPKQCRVPEGRAGDCRVRVNLDGRLRASTYGAVVAVHVDPVEKKPFFHFHPGKPILSVATAGCNLHCDACQNWEISQANPEEAEARSLSPEALADLAAREGTPFVAFTYTEPIVYYEYAYDAAVACRERGIGSALVTAGYANDAPMRELLKVVRAATVDVKSFEESFYRERCGGGLKPVLNTLVATREEGAWLEVSTLVIPGLTDGEAPFREMCRWMRRNLGDDTPFHLLRFQPHHRLQNLPPTPVATLQRLWDAAREEGLRYVYLGNVPGHDSESTRCAACGAVVVERTGYRLGAVRLQAGRCPACGATVPGVWEGAP